MNTSSCVRHANNASRWACVILSLAVMGSLTWGAEAAYRLRPGDRLELKVIGLPELSEKVLIDLDGQVSLPLLSPMKVSGLTVAEVQERIRAVLPSKVVYRRSLDGKKVPFVADADEITVEIAEYRPIYVGGDVPKPGEQAFRPGMRVRHALALSGGNDMSRLRLGTDLLNIFDYHGNREVLLLDLAREQARYWRIQAELNGKPELSFEEFVKGLPPVRGVAAMAKSEADQFAVRMADWRNENAYLQQAAKQAVHRAKVLAQQYDTENKGSTADSEELDRMKGLLERSVTSQNRVTEARRAMLISATRVLQTGVQLAAAEREQEERARMLQKAIDQRRLDLMRELEESALRLASTKSRIEINGRKLAFLNGAGTQLLSGKSDKPEITISREDDEGVQRIAANEDTLLAPGDVIEVTYKQTFDFSLEAEPRPKQ